MQWNTRPSYSLPLSISTSLSKGRAKKETFEVSLADQRIIGSSIRPIRPHEIGPCGSMCNSFPKTTSNLESAEEDRNPEDVDLSEEQGRKSCDHKPGHLPIQEEIVGKQNRPHGKNIGIVQPVEKEKRGK